MNEMTSLSEIKTTEIGAKSPESGSRLREARTELNAICSNRQDVKLRNTDNANIDISKNIDNEKWGGKYTDSHKRLELCPVEGKDRGSWEGERGMSKYIPSSETEGGRRTIEKLSEYGLDGIEYKNLEPDFSPCSEGTVEIDRMSAYREGDTNNFLQADQKLSEKWNIEKKDGRSDWTAKDVKQYRKENNLSWHERCDMKTMDLVPQEIHGSNDYRPFPHSGGVAECKARDNKETIFDE